MNETPAQMPIDAIIKAADHGALMSDRWMMIVIFGLFIFTIWLVAKFFLSQLSLRDQTISDLQVNLAALQKTFNEFLMGQNLECMRVIQHNSEVVHSNTVMSEKKMTILKEIEAFTRGKDVASSESAT